MIIKVKSKQNYFTQTIMLALFSIFFSVYTESRAEVILLSDLTEPINFTDTHDPDKGYVSHFENTQISIHETIAFPIPRHAVYVDIFTNNSGSEMSLTHMAYFPLNQIFPSVNFTHADGNGRFATVTSNDGWSASITDLTPGDTFPIPFAGVINSPAFGLGVVYHARLTDGQSVTFQYEFSFSSPESGISVPVWHEFIISVPEPETYAMLLVGLGFIGFLTHRRKI